MIMSFVESNDTLQYRRDIEHEKNKSCKNIFRNFT